MIFPQMRGLRSLVSLFAVGFLSFSVFEPSSHAKISYDSVLFEALEFPFVPDPQKTTGSLCSPDSPDFERFRYEERIAYCRRNVDRIVKDAIYDGYQIPKSCRKDYTIDHFVPLSIGGTNGLNNLWPEHKSIKALRLNLENNLYKQISTGEISQAEAVKIINEAKWNPPVENPDDFDICH